MSDLEFKVVDSLDEFREALRLRFEVFGKEEYLDQKRFPFRMEYDSHDLLSQTTLFIAKSKGNVVGTVRLVQDSEYGLPLERLADFSRIRKEVDSSEKRKLSEGSRIVTLPQYRKEGISEGLFKIGLTYAAKNGITDVISVANLGKGKGDVQRFNVAEKIFINKLCYVPAGPEFFHEEFNEYALPLNLRIADISGHFRKYMEQKTPDMQEPYDQLDFNRL